MGKVAKVTLDVSNFATLVAKASSFDRIVRTVKFNIDKNDIYPVHEDEIILLTGLSKYQYDHVQAMANHAAGKMPEKMPDILDEILREEPTKEDRSNAENQTEL